MRQHQPKQPNQDHRAHAPGQLFRVRVLNAGPHHVLLYHSACATKRAVTHCHPFASPPIRVTFPSPLPSIRNTNRSPHHPSPNHPFPSSSVRPEPVEGPKGRKRRKAMHPSRDSVEPVKAISSNGTPKRYKHPLTHRECGAPLSLESCAATAPRWAPPLFADSAETVHPLGSHRIRQARRRGPPMPNTMMPQRVSSANHAVAPLHLKEDLTQLAPVRRDAIGEHQYCLQSLFAVACRLPLGAARRHRQSSCAGARTSRERRR